ncbi:hypothetical protein EBR96_10800, partial [bacterium]|nr:hypothetical protein [bacterium]
ALTESIRDRLQKQGAEAYENAVRNQLIDAVVNGSEIEVQPVLVDREVDQLVREFDSNIRRIGYNMEQYLAASDMTLEKLRESYRNNAENRVKADLVLNAIADAESIAITDDDLVNEIVSWNAKDLDSEAAAKKYLKKINQDGLRYAVRRQKTLDFIVEHAKIS